ncbi:NAD(P)/FAD-dependent oxidoreductase [Sphingomonas sp. LaA6.9]|uniref:NAD(P)/FAD-dependent oxidoreductase n=1 Tax=Sphingomonas sp. LaA6.9 TaxID=2919914 RepID=UPI001F4FA5C6|nr:FAD-dependent monooxygenase [Sphingomonas sp. LaA6.9]MCJ8159231.1 FAD-dependent monooxygenase [Sphingomonas sp. LaA6.9]
MRRTDTLILGGGPAGSAAAIMLARGGAQPLLIERNRETGDSLCGGFLSWRSLETLMTLGVTSDDLEGHRIDRVRFLAGSSRGEALLPGHAMGISRRRLDTLLLARAKAAGARIEHGCGARHAEPGWVTLVDGAMIACESLFLATGKRDCRGMARPHTDSDLALGLRLRLPASAALTRTLGSAIELHLFRGGYAGLLMQEDGSGNLCMTVQKSRLAAADGDPRKLLAGLGDESPHLGARLALADPMPDIDAIGAVPYGWRARHSEAGLFRLGDQAAVIPSLAGEGMGIALASGVMAARHWRSAGRAGGTAFQADLARRTRIPVIAAGGVSALAATGWGRQAAPWLLASFPTLGAMIAQFTRIAF